MIPNPFRCITAWTALPLLIVALGVAAPAPAQPGSRVVLQSEPGWPGLQIIHPEQGARYPRGHVEGVPVRFHIHNGTLFRNGFRLAVIVEGRRYIQTRDEGFFLDNLQPGSHRVRFELLDRQGNLVPGGTSVQERTFHVGPSRPPARPASRTEPALTIAPRTYQPSLQENPGAAVSGSANGFTARPGGRREGPVPDLEAPSSNASRSDPESNARNGSTAVPSVNNGREINPSGVAVNGSDAREVAPAPAQNSATNSATTVSESLRRTLQDAGRRLQDRDTLNRVEPLRTVRGRTAETTPTLRLDTRD